MRDLIKRLAARGMDGRPDSSPPTLLTPEQYDRAERAIRAGISLPALMAFQPVTFERVGYPTRVDALPEVLRYVDHNFEPETAKLYEDGAVFEPVGYKNAFAEDERALFASLRERVADLTETAYGRRTKPISNLLVQSGPFRAIDQMRRQLGRAPGDVTVFEIGPGAGYLGALLSLQGYRYYSYDVAQALYLWQSHLLQACAGVEFVEHATQPETSVGGSRVGHFPWWRFADMLGSPPFKADIVYSNSNLGEMGSLCLHFVLHIARQMLEDSPLGAFCYFSEGMQMQNSIESIEANLAAYGFTRAVENPLKAHALADAGVQTLQKAFADGLEPYNPSGGPVNLTAREMVPTPPEEYPLDIPITRWLHGWTPP